MSEQASAVIHNSIVFEQTQEDSLTDPLTGLPNTRFMFMHLTRELARAERLKAEVALLVMDLDNFKEINDNHGHHVGDRALREVATVLRAGIRPYDICVRYAGDEFIVVLSGCGADEAERKRVELQRTVDEVLFEARPGRRLPLAISVGAAIYPAGRRQLRSAAGHRRQPHVSRQDAPQAARARAARARPAPTACRPCPCRCRSAARRSPRSTSSAPGLACSSLRLVRLVRPEAVSTARSGSASAPHQASSAVARASLTSCGGPQIRQHASMDGNASFSSASSMRPRRPVPLRRPRGTP